MNDKRDAIDDLLVEWYEYEDSYRPALGYGRADPACRNYRPGRYRDSDELAELAERSARRQVCEAVGDCVRRLELRHRIAIQTVMRNWLSGATVWRAGRLNGEDPEAIYAEAKRALAPLLRARSLIEALDFSEIQT
ncbi:hypothetical protein K7G19_19795 [Cupriavidus sp. DB3]|uniref:hypothetical protein n=1 Tax=Cupriavidus sp. DB3 TaxID=2873259 RepID=UPI001CF17051|nr:hypothetical protein [Cupriavidus sp. DB3]MCA7085836.1 hypothetical protein [Cupriavidus sp. DB3]